MTLTKQIRQGASQFLDTLEYGWNQLVSRSGRALTRFTRRMTSDHDSTQLPDLAESWSLLAGEISETDSHVLVRLEAPGMEKKDFDIQIDGRRLRIRGEKRFQKEQKKADYHLFESAYGAFERVLTLPSEVDGNEAEASYRRGILTVRLPKAITQNLRRIEVR